MRLEAGPLVSMFEAVIPFCWIAVRLPLFEPSRWKPGGLKAPSSAPGGVGSAFCEGYGVAEVAPGQYSLVCATCVFRKSRKGNCTRKGRLGSRFVEKGSPRHTRSRGMVSWQQLRLVEEVLV